jgi:ligand-binding sensor domain-containing protein
MGTEDGLLHQRENGLIRYGSQEGLSNTLINDLYFDDEGILWVSTYGGGANVFLGEYVVNYDLSNTLSNNLVTSFIEKKNGDLWIGSYGGGVQILSKDFASFTTSSDTRSQLATSKWPVLQNLPDQRVYHLSQDPNGRTWIGMREALSYFRNDKVVTVEEEHFPYRKIRHIRWANSSTMWVSTYDHGLIKVEYTDLYSPETWSLTQFSTQIPTWPSNTVLKSIEDRNGTIWVATYAGVVELNQDGMIRTWGLAEGLPNVSVMGVMEDSQGSIWAHTFGGLAKISQNELVPITEKDGLPSRVCYFLYEDTQNSNLLWIGTNGGLIKYNVQDSTFKTITQEEGLISNEMNLGAFYEDSQGQFWLGTVEGLSKFDPKRYRGNEVSPRVHIEEVLISGVNVNLLTTEKLRTDFNQNFFEVAFIGLNYTAPDQLYYRYRLAGLEEQWQQTKNTSLRYSSLPSGDYTFQVQSLNSNGLVSQEIAEVRFKVKPPIYQNIWFWTGIIMLIAWVLYLIRRTAMVTKLVDMERMRVRIASDLHDDVGASLTEIALQSDFLLAGTVQRELKDSLTQIGRQCRKIVGSLDDIVWSIDARNDSLGDLTDRIQDYALGVLDLMQFDIEYAFDSLPMEKKIPVEIRENTYLIIKEALNNVVKYSNGDRVVIRLTLEEHTLNAVVSDNGYAITNSKKTGHGLRNMEMRAQRMNGILTIDNKDGFSVSLQVPLSN